MGKRKASFPAVADLYKKLGDELFIALADPANTGKVKDFLQSIAIPLPRLIENQEEAIDLLAHKVKDQPYTEDDARRLLQAWADIPVIGGPEYKGSVLWQQPPMFTLKQSAPLTGHCWEDYDYLQDWNFEDVPTSNSLCFWKPRLLADSTSKDVKKQMVMLTELRQQHKLPDHHLSSFGIVSQQVALILAHFRRTGERVPFNMDWIRTDALRADGGRLGLGDFDGDGLHCDDYDWDDGRNGHLGVFPLGVEELGA